jgi:hypothetical protein
MLDDYASAEARLVEAGVMRRDGCFFTMLGLDATCQPHEVQDAIKPLIDNYNPRQRGKNTPANTAIYSLLREVRDVLRNAQQKGAYEAYR